MAFYPNTIDNSPKASLAARMGQRLARFFANIADNQNRTGTVKRMQDLSDDKLAQMGVRREDIVRHVYRDIYYV
jgi:uncharacterized protein YjiS (DUF1127 family)